jgi:hypothetical protein
MFILPPNCIVPSATSLTISPVLPNFLYFISNTPSAANEKRLAKHPLQGRIDQSERPSAIKIVAGVHFRSITAACASITGEIIADAQSPGIADRVEYLHLSASPADSDPFYYTYL